MFIEQIQPLIAQHGYWAVFFIVMLESAGVPLPGETVLLLAAGYAGATGNLDIVWVVIAAAAGAIIGDNIGFWVGRTFGAKLLVRYGKFIHLPESRLRLGQHLFEKHGGKIVFFGRFVAFLRVLAALLAGVNKYSWGKFLFFNATGGVLWAILMGAGAFFFGDAMHRVSGPLGVLALLFVVAGVVVAAILMRREEKKLADQITDAG
ncbi:SNARE associated Golgi protein [Methylocella silvestris BL2]|uniref:SNARE associated Golgi protein n=1 Tax=Methylocella silvestris (strain DSM 15510 / CIP 108128 / LMG 27833 / NCIMB 13906 / BL2) TaxID=395965 RepID=B8ELQ7_METSB|nr:DedA family protein [Methylocella silvestris]ACK50051.1 SNARE associated Golgi protein [Methylocella silvestris BL2]